MRTISWGLWGLATARLSVPILPNGPRGSSSSPNRYFRAVDPPPVPPYDPCPSVGAWRSLVARCNGVAEVGGSNPLAPTISLACRATGYVRAEQCELVAGGDLSRNAHELCGTVRHPIAIPPFLVAPLAQARGTSWRAVARKWRCGDVLCGVAEVAGSASSQPGPMLRPHICCQMGRPSASKQGVESRKDHQGK